MDRRAFIKGLIAASAAATAVPAIVSEAQANSFKILGTITGRWSALDRENTRRVLLKIMNDFEIMLDYLRFEPNDDMTRSQIVTVGNQILDFYTRHRVIYYGATNCDMRYNTPTMCDAGIKGLAISIQPNIPLYNIEMQGRQGIDGKVLWDVYMNTFGPQPSNSEHYSI